MITGSDLGIVIVGASLAGTQAAQAIRRAGYDGPMTMVGDEQHYPYDRPPLSKNYLTDDEVDEAKLRLRPTVDPETLSVDWLLGMSAVSIDVQAATINLEANLVGRPDGRLESMAGPTEVRYDGLVVATGARARRLPGADSVPQGVLELRTLDDARALRAALTDRPATGKPLRLAVCGAGFIGAEVAASARQLGIDVTLIDLAEIPLDRVLDRPTGVAVADLHRQHGVELRLGVAVAGFTAGADGRVQTVELSDGSSVPADVVVVGIGVVPNTEWLDDPALTVDNGLVVDETCLAAPSVVAAGDVARWPNQRFGGRSMRVEQWDNAVEMGMYAGRRLLSALSGDDPDEPFAPVPWFWSDQYDRKMQLAGLATDNAVMVQGSLAEQRFVQVYLDDDGALVGTLCWNRPRQAIQARQLIADRATVDEAVERLS